MSFRGEAERGVYAGKPDFQAEKRGIGMNIFGSNFAAGTFGIVAR